MQQLAGILNENNASSELDSFLRGLANKPLLNGYLLDYNFDSPGMLILHISKESSKPGQYTKDVKKQGTATYYTDSGKWSFDGNLGSEIGQQIGGKGMEKATLDRIAKLAGVLKEETTDLDVLKKDYEHCISQGCTFKRGSTQYDLFDENPDSWDKYRNEFKQIGLSLLYNPMDNVYTLKKFD